MRGRDKLCRNSVCQSQRRTKHEIPGTWMSQAIHSQWEKNAALYNVGKVWNFLIRQEKKVCSHWPRKLCVLVLAHHQEILSCLLQSWTLTCLQRWSCKSALLATVSQASSSRNTWSQAAIPLFLFSFSEHGLPLRPLCVCCRGDPTCLSPSSCTLDHPLSFKGAKVKKFLPRTLPILVF